MEKTITIDGREIKFKATANTPRLYRLKFRRDMMRDMAELAKQHKRGRFDIPDLTMFENIAYTMANAQIGEISDWLDEFKVFDIYEVLPELFELWGANLETTVTSKKNKLKAIAR